ncbi:hypothetical protein [Nisaea sp.]|uniref:hypothetical protein n=1 Tax=Nisaea sp. TaxID=2024842 RepID=UPI0032ED3896
MKKAKTDSDYPQEEAEKRRDELLGNLLRTPPQPRPERDRTPKHEFVVMDGKFRVAVIKSQSDGRMIADVYKNLDDLRAGQPIERDAHLTVG